MVMTMIIAIIAVVIFGVFCFLCVYFLFNNQKNTKRNEERMKLLEYKMGLMGDLINRKTDMLAEKMSGREIRIEADKPVEVTGRRQAAERAEEYDTISLEELFDMDESSTDDFGDDFEDVLAEEEAQTPGTVPAAQAGSAEPAIQARTVGQAAPVVPSRFAEPAVPPTNMRFAAPTASPSGQAEYREQSVPPAQTVYTETPEPLRGAEENEERIEIGKSGKKYSFSELEQLIRE